MGYSCPVCDDPQADGVHLANHLAITAMTRGGAHEQFLDDTVPGWQELGEDELAERLRGAAEETDYPQVFEDTTDHDHEHSHDHHGGTNTGQRSASPVPFETEIPDDPSEDDAGEILEEAMELTRKRREHTEDSDADSADGETDGPETE